MFINEKESDILKSKNEKFISEVGESYSLYENIFDEFPLCLCIWDYRLDIVSCNDLYVDLLKMNSKEDFVENIFGMSPEKQPDGQLSSTKMLDLITRTFKNGKCQSHWIHIDTEGNEILTQLTLKKYEPDDKKTHDVVFMYAEKMDIKKITIDELDFENNVLYDEMIYRLILQQVPEITQNIWFCYDVKKTNLKYFKKDENQKARLVTSSNFPNGIIKEGFIYKNDILTYFEIIDDVHSGIEKNSDIRLVIDGEPVWHEVNYEIIRDKMGEIALVIGKLTSIKDQAKLESKGKLDGLTNCYNRDAFNRIITDVITSSSYEEEHTIWITEINDINTMNVKYGVQFTDLVLIDVANQLNEKLDDCIIGRIHGKFVIFKKNSGNDAVTEQISKDIVECFVNKYDASEGNVCKTSCNIGIAQFPKQGKTLIDIYTAGTTALEHSKIKGENAYLNYNESLDQKSLEQLNEIADESIADRTKVVASDLCLDVFNILHTNNVKKEEKITIALEKIANSCILDRCFILVRKEDEYEAINSYAKEGFDNNIESRSAEYVRKIFKNNSNNQGILIDKTGDIKSQICAKIIIDGEFKYVFVFEKHNEEHIWTDVEINTISQIAQIFSVFM